MYYLIPYKFSLWLEDNSGILGLQEIAFVIDPVSINPPKI